MFSGVGNLTTFSAFNFSVWYALAFQAGVINVGGFLACNRYVTHITGSLSRLTVEFSLGHLQLALGALVVPVCFFIGTLVSANFIDRKILNSQKPNYKLVFFVLSSLFFLVSLSGSLGHFGFFGEHLSYNNEYSLLIILAFCAGLQNAAITTASGTVVRTTHMTGILTDFGIGALRLFSNKLGSPAQIHYEKRAFGLRLGLLFFFALGGVVGGFLFSKIQFLGFLIPFFISFCLFLVAHARSSKNV